jgi:hypothetical protein
MALDELELNWRELARLGENLGRYAHLADVVEKTRYTHVFDLFSGHSHVSGNRHGKFRHTALVACGVRVSGLGDPAYDLDHRREGMLEPPKAEVLFCRELRLDSGVLSHESCLLDVLISDNREFLGEREERLGNLLESLEWHGWHLEESRFELITVRADLIGVPE